MYINYLGGVRKEGPMGVFRTPGLVPNECFWHPNECRWMVPGTIDPRDD